MDFLVNSIKHLRKKVERILPDLASEVRFTLFLKPDKDITRTTTKSYRPTALMNINAIKNKNLIKFNLH